MAGIRWCFESVPRWARTYFVALGWEMARLAAVFVALRTFLGISSQIMIRMERLHYTWDTEFINNPTAADNQKRRNYGSI
jgi:hypothetical protein